MTLTLPSLLIKLDFHATVTNLVNLSENRAVTWKQQKNQLSKWMNSPANLIPLSPESNLKWRTMEPSQAIEKLRINSSEQLEELTLSLTLLL